MPIGLGAAMIGSSIGSSALQTGGNIISTAMTNKANADIQASINDMNYKIAQEANALSVEEAQKNRDWQTEMANTEVQRKMADMKAAGVNPLLAVSQGGASAGSVGNPDMKVATMQAHKNNAASIQINDISSALGAANQLQNYAKLVASTGNKYDAESIYKKALATKVDLYNSGVTSSAKLANQYEKMYNSLQKDYAKLADKHYNYVSTHKNLTDIYNVDWLHSK